MNLSASVFSRLKTALMRFLRRKEKEGKRGDYRGDKGRINFYSLGNYYR